MKRTTTLSAVICSLALLLLPLLVRPALGQIQTTSSSFHGDAVYFQREQLVFETRVLAEVLDMSGSTTLYDQTLSSSGTILSNFQISASGDLQSTYDASKDAAAASMGSSFPITDISGVIGDPNPPDVSSALALATALLEAAAPGSIIDQADNTIIDITQSIQQTSFSSQPSSVTTFFPDPVSGPNVNIHTHTDVTETFLLTQNTLNQTTIRLTATRAAAVPEPHAFAIWSLLGIGLVGFGYYRLRRKH